MTNKFDCSHARLRPRQASALGVAALTFLGMAGLGAPAEAASAAGAGIFNVHILSAGLAINVHDPNLVLQPDVSVGPYTALATLDNLGQSTAQAGAPFLGDYVGPLVGHVNGLSAGQAPPAPPIPGEVRSSYPGQPSAAQRNGGYAIEATSGQQESKASVALGPTAPGAGNATFFSLADARADQRGALKAVGSAGADALNIAGVLDIGRVSSLITMTQSGSGAPKFLSATDVGTVTVSGQKFGLNEKGLTAAGSSSGASPAQVNDAMASLKQAGISIRYVPGSVTYAPGTRTVQSMESGAVEISYEHEVPSQGLVTNTYTLGYVQVDAAASSFGTASSTAGNAPSPGSRESVRSPAAPTGDLAAPARTSATPFVGGSAASIGTAQRVDARQRRADGDDQSVAIITPTLRFMRFGSTLGLPDGCNIVFGAVGAGAAEAGGGSDAGSALSNGVDGCTQLGNAGGEQLTAAMAGVAPLTVINPAVNPGIDAFADALESIGNDHAAAVAPFGPTIAGMGSSARFFKGCETC